MFRQRLSAHPRIAAIIIGALLTASLTGCGSTAGVRSGTTTASAVSGFTSFNAPQYSLRLPTLLKHTRLKASGGRVQNTWTDQIGSLIIEAVYDPRPAGLAASVRTGVAGARTGYHPSRLTVRPVSIPGATGAKLITDSGRDPKLPDTPESGAELIARRAGGGSVEVLVIAHGRDNVDPVTVARSLTLKR